MNEPDGDLSGCTAKRWNTLTARAALAGWQLWRSDPDDGVQRYFASRWGMVRALADLGEIELFLEQLERR